MVLRAGVGLARGRLAQCAQEQPLCSLSDGRWRSTRACRARASRRACSKWPYSSRGPARYRQGSLAQYKDVVLRASLGLVRGRLAHVRKSSHCARSLSGGGAKCSLVARARHAAQVRTGPIALEGQRASDRAHSLVQGRDATRWRWPHARPACTCAQERPLCSLSVGRGAARALAVRARAARACRARATRRAGSNWSYVPRTPVRQ